MVGILIQRVADEPNSALLTSEVIEKVAMVLYAHEASRLVGDSAPSWENARDSTREFFRVSASVAVDASLTVLHEHGTQLGWCSCPGRL